MKYNIQINKVDKPLEVGCLTDKGRITKILANFIWTINGGGGKEAVTPISISLKEKANMEEQWGEINKLKEYQCSPELEDKLLQLYNEGVREVEEGKDFVIKNYVASREQYADLPTQEVKQEKDLSIHDKQIVDWDEALQEYHGYLNRTKSELVFTDWLRHQQNYLLVKKEQK